MDHENTSLALDAAFVDMSSLTTSTSLANGSASNQDANVAPATNATATEDEVNSVILFVMLTCFIIVGSVGNALAIYVFASLKQKLTSTIFILTLAGTDFMTCVITIPFTIYMEYVKYHVGSDFICKMYHFLSTTTVPFSAVVMVAIAVDRYMCICHPFHHWMTIRRARIIIGILLIYVSFYGITISIHYSINWPMRSTLNVTDDSVGHSHNVSTTASDGNLTGYFNVDGLLTNSTSYFVSFVSGNDVDVSGSPQVDGNATHVGVAPVTRTKSIPRTVKTNECLVHWDYIDEQFMITFRNIYFANFALSCAIVLVLYSLIYRYVISQRKKKLRIKSAQCCLLWNARSIETHHESVEITQDIELSNVNGEKYNARLMSNDEATATAAENHNNGSTRKCSISKARIERMRVANIKTAFTLSIVNVVFILAFLPAWLMVMRFLTMDVILFYTHFFYNVCNPLIYAFLNQNFKAELKRILHCGKV